MSRLSDIPVRVMNVGVPPASSQQRVGGLGGGVHAILAELATMLGGLADRQEGGTIDLRSLPMEHDDRAALQDALGVGEVSATLDAGGVSHFRETGVPGIWWIEHRDPEGLLVAELLEVAALPAILACVPDEIAAGPDLLRARIAALATSARKVAGGQQQ